MLPKISEVGKIWKELEIRYTPSGKAVVDLPLVFNKRKKTDNGGYVDDGILWLYGTLWGTYAENAAETLTKGDQVMVSGELYEDEYEDRKTGEKRKSIKLRVYDVAPILKWNSAKINRAERSSQQTETEDDPWSRPPADPPLDTDTEAPF